MQIQVQFTFANETEFVEFNAKFAGNAAPIAAPVKAVAAEKATKAPTAKKEVAKVEESLSVKEEPQAEAQQEAAAKEEPKEVEANFDGVKSAILSVSRTKGRDAAVAVLAKFGATQVRPDLKEKDYAAVIAECKSVLAA